MSYTPPPTFVTDAVLSAAQLNILSDDIAYLYGLSQSVNPPLPRTFSVSSIVDTWLIRHRARYLYVSFTWDKGTDPGADFPLLIEYNNVELLNTTLGAPGGTNNYQLDLNPLSLTDGTFYEIEIAAFTNSFSGTSIQLNYMYEAD